LKGSIEMHWKWPLTSFLLAGLYRWPGDSLYHMQMPPWNS
jgi:hypothetical protein